jgi:CCR4-NOT transcription complex subunit 1
MLRTRTQLAPRRDPQSDGNFNQANRAPAAKLGAGREEDGSSIGFPNLSSFIVFNPSITLFTTQPALKRIVHIAIDRSIREVMQSPVVERSVNIAINATREIVSKDFALEPSEEKMRKAALCMAQNLAGALASVSSREPLKVSMISNLRSLLIANGFTEQTVPEKIIFLVVGDNLDLACSVMERVAAEKCVPDKDERLMASFIARRKYREQRPGKPFYDPVVYTGSRYLSALPEPIRPSVGGVTPSQMRVYEDFVNDQASVSHSISPHAERPSRALLQRTEGRNESNSNQLLTLQQVVEKFSLVGNELERIILENGNANLESLGPKHEIKVTVQQIFRLISQSANPDECCLLFAEKLVGMLYKANLPLAREVYVLVLRRFFEISKTLPKELKDWFLYSEDEV